MKVVLITLPKFLMANLFQEGGSLFMSLILISLLASIAFLIKGFLSLQNGKLSKKMLALAGDSGLLGMVLGFLGSVLGLIQAFDVVQSIGNIDSGVFAGGLKVSLLTSTFGLLTFAISRVGILILRLVQQEKQED